MDDGHQRVVILLDPGGTNTLLEGLVEGFRKREVYPHTSPALSDPYVR